MDLELLKTFLEVNRSRHFGQAAERLYISQSAVSMRIRQLEEIVGVRLFNRERNNIQLTAAGERLLRHAETILMTWNRARQEIGVDEQSRIPLVIGGVPSLWDILLQGWTQRVFRALPELQLTAEVHGPEVLVRRLLDGTLDLAFMFEPPQTPELIVEEIARVPLVLISRDPQARLPQLLHQGYVWVDWGTSFAIAHARHFPEAPAPAIRMGLGRLAKDFLLECGGSAYLAEPMVATELAEGRLHRVTGAPVIDRQAYAVFPTRSERKEELERALELARQEKSPAVAGDSR